MTRQQFLRRLFGVIATPLALPVWASVEASEASEEIQKLEKPLSAWRTLLSQDAYEVLFEEDTERPHSSPLNQEKRRGTYICAACYLGLFDSDTKIREWHRVAQLFRADRRAASEPSGTFASSGPARSTTVSGARDIRGTCSTTARSPRGNGGATTASR